MNTIPRYCSIIIPMETPVGEKRTKTTFKIKPSIKDKLIEIEKILYPYADEEDSLTHLALEQIVSEYYAHLFPTQSIPPVTAHETDPVVAGEAESSIETPYDALGVPTHIVETVE